MPERGRWPKFNFEKGSSWWGSVFDSLLPETPVEKDLAVLMEENGLRAKLVAAQLLPNSAVPHKWFKKSHFNENGEYLVGYTLQYIQPKSDEGCEIEETPFILEQYQNQVAEAVDFSDTDLEFIYEKSKVFRPSGDVE